jgi:hypothetical protein
LVPPATLRRGHRGLEYGGFPRLRLNPPSPGGQILLFALGIICAGLGRRSLLLLRTYVGYAARFVRTGLRVGASATTIARA